MMVGLQGSGKTTTTAKIAKRLTELNKSKVLMASLDTRRPAAMEQLAVLGKQVEVDTLPIVAGQTPPQIAKRAIEAAKLGGYDVVLLDTAGRITLDEAMMAEAAEVKRAADPHEVLLVADALTGQDAVNLARSFDERVGLTGIVLTRVDGDGRGGAALSMRAVTGKPIKLIGTGEKMDALEDFDPSRIAGRILGMGDIVSLVEKAAANIDAEKARAHRRADAQGRVRSHRSARAARADAEARRHVRPDGHDAGRRQDEEPDGRMPISTIRCSSGRCAIIDSMTPKERRNPDILKASRKKRIAAGSGTTPEADQQAAENASRHGRHDEGDGRRQARPDGAARQRDGHGRRHAVGRRDAENGGEDAGAGRRLAARHARDAEPADEYSAECRATARPRRRRNCPGSEDFRDSEKRNDTRQQRSTNQKGN